VFYGEARLSVAAGGYRAFALAIPEDPGFERVPSMGVVVKPGLGPGEYREFLVEKLEEILRVAGEPGGDFDVGGVRGLLRGILEYLFSLGKRSVEVRGTPRLEARLAAYYVREGLGLSGDEELVVYPETYWLPVEVEVVGERRIVARHPGGEFRVLEKLIEVDDNAWRVLAGVLGLDHKR